LGDLDRAWPFLVPIAAIIGAFTVAIVNSIGRARVRELEIRERIAMIERGMVPSPESDPNGFERRMHAMDRIQHVHAGSRFRAGGVMVMSVGFGLMMLLWFVGAPREGVGIGGFLVIIGFGLFINSLFNYSPQQPITAAQPPRQEPPNPSSTGPQS
jgi:uncharacterized protein DUF6249